MSLDDRDFYLFGDFDEDMLTNVAKPLMQAAIRLPANAPNYAPERLNVYINSYGGYAHVARTVLDAISTARARGIVVATYATGAAYSAGSMVAVAGTPGYRYMSPTAHHLLHFGWAGADGTNPVELERAAKMAQQHFSFVLDHYSRYARVPRLREKLNDDSLFVDSATAIRWGLADKEF